MNTNSHSKGFSNNCEIVIPIILKIPIYLEPVVIEVSPICSFSSHVANLSEPELTLVTSTHDRLQKTPEHLSGNAMPIAVQKSQALIKHWMYLVQVEFAFKLNALAKRIKFLFNRILRTMNRFVYQFHRGDRSSGSHFRRRGSNARRVFH